MIINLRTLDCLKNSPCQSHWKYIENSMEEMHVNFRILTKYNNVELHNLIKIAVTVSNVLIFTSLTKTESSKPIQNVKRIKAKRQKRAKRNGVVKTALT